MGDDLRFTDLKDINVNPQANLESTVLSIDETNATGQRVKEISPIEEKNDCQKRIPKRILHFSDGILEEFSSDDDDDDDAMAQNSDLVDAQALVDPATSTWGPYVWYQVTKLGNSTLAACDYLGGHLAHFFGITSPKYQFEINEYFKMKAEEEEEKQKQDEEGRGWKEKSTVALVNSCGGKETVELVAQQPYSAEEAKERIYL